MQRRVLLVILDGWGIAPASPYNALSVAETPNFDMFWSKYLHVKLGAAEESVGLPKGQIGNSEVGHLNIGAGRVVLQDLPRISRAIQDGTFFQNKVLADTIIYAKENHKPLHLVGLVSAGGVHSHEEHLYALLSAAKHHGLHEVYVHMITDGRDVNPHSAARSVERLEEKMASLGVGKIATVCGRYYAMDRDKRWDRTKMVYDALVFGKGDVADNAAESVEVSYALGITDEFIKPTVINRKGLIQDSDAVIFFNFRSDRPRQLAESLVSPGFNDFKPIKRLKNLYLVTMTEYESNLRTSGIIFPQENLRGTLSEVISEAGLTQFHIAETEKYAHVTYYFEGGSETQQKGEDRLMIPSPKVATYDLAPEMSAEEVKNELIARIGKYDFLIANFANPDMVGHTGKMKAAIKAAKKVDQCLGEVVSLALSHDYDVIVIADHGNIEKMAEADGTPYTAHTTNPVPFVLISNQEYHFDAVSEPKLANIAPTIIRLMGLPRPSVMTEKSLIK